jgi:DNA invertase Pin-like site-specific DNA recombinase
MKPSTIRCAIYTRKSSDEGLEQDFNSLDAQREACAAYIRSQASQGWREIAERYDDGGFSGGTLERPALKRLLVDVAALRIDIILVYKVDRLSRSLFDFAKLVEAFEKAEASFVSITQALNTTSSMGRLTLNMLLSFAQFEREVTAERIRDKLAASKAKGMWMGGVSPLGYRPDGRSLAVVEEHDRSDPCRAAARGRQRQDAYRRHADRRLLGEASDHVAAARPGGVTACVGLCCCSRSRRAGQLTSEERSIGLERHLAVGFLSARDRPMPTNIRRSCLREEDERTAARRTRIHRLGLPPLTQASPP